MQGKYKVHYNVSSIVAYVNILFIPAGNPDTQIDLTNRTIASIPNHDYTFEVMVPCDGTIAVRSYSANGRTSDAVSFNSVNFEEVVEW